MELHVKNHSHHQTFFRDIIDLLFLSTLHMPRYVDHTQLKQKDQFAFTMNA